jgi:hypothetical protein
VELDIEIADDALEVGLIEDLFAFGDTEEESTAAEIVDPASDALYLSYRTSAFGVIVDATDKTIAKDLSLGTGDPEMVFDVASSFFEIEGREVETNGDALVEGLEGGETKLVGKIRLAEQNEGDEGSGIHIIIEQKTELLEDVGREQMSFVDDEQNAASFAGEIGERGVKLRQQLRKVKQRFGLKSEQNLGVQGNDGEARVGKIDDGVDVGIEGAGKGTEGGRFAGADFAGDESGETLLESESETSLDLAVAARGKEVAGGDRFCERRQLKAIEIIQSGHCFPPHVLQNPWAKGVG